MFVQVLLPEKRMLFQPNLAKAVGSNYVARRIEELKPLAHVYGHTHFAWDTTIKGVRYLQWPLAYPRERKYVTSLNLKGELNLCGGLVSMLFVCCVKGLEMCRDDGCTGDEDTRVVEWAHVPVFHDVGSGV
jgi:hypothetical protein